MKNNMAQILYYDDEELEIYDVINTAATESLADDMKRCEIIFKNKPVVARLDPTTMSRIAKYNNEIEIRELEKKVAVLREEVISSNYAIRLTERKIKCIEKVADMIFSDHYFDEEKYIGDTND